MAQARCINIDWLEVYCLESTSNFPCNAEFFRSRGLYVQEREYGTRVYKEMFTILDEHGIPYLEVRRNPFSTQGHDRGFFSPNSCHIRLHNSTCYRPNPIDILRQFLTTYDYELRKIYRLDICYDFEYFDEGDDPQKFITRYMNGKYSKINQTNLSAHGVDSWGGREWHSLSWGQPKSMVSTKMYCKTLELQQTHDKPYIRDAWLSAGLIDDTMHLLKRKDDGTMYHPDIWRVEFSVKSSANKWFRIDRATRKKGKIPMPHTLDMYDSREKLLTIFNSLAYHYFHFKVYEDGQRKDRCKDKVLFRFSPNDVFYQVDRLASHTANTKPELRLEILLKNFYLAHPFPEVAQAVDILTKYLHDMIALKYSSPKANRLEREAYQLLMKRRVQGDNRRNIIDQFHAILAEIHALNGDFF